MAVRFAACPEASLVYQKFGIDVAGGFGHPLDNEGIPSAGEDRHVRREDLA